MAPVRRSQHPVAYAQNWSVSTPFSQSMRKVSRMPGSMSSQRRAARFVILEEHFHAFTRVNFDAMNFEANQQRTHRSDRDPPYGTEKRAVTICGIQVPAKEIAPPGEAPTCPSCLLVIERRRNLRGPSGSN